MKFAHFFIRRPIFAGVLSAGIFLVGMIAMWRLPISEYPEVVPPTIVVRATYPGANPKTIAETVAYYRDRLAKDRADRQGFRAASPAAQRMIHADLYPAA